jgi:hypothetical protein
MYENHLKNSFFGLCMCFSFLNSPEIEISQTKSQIDSFKQRSQSTGLSLSLPSMIKQSPKLPPRPNEFIVLVTYHQLRKKMILKGVKSVEDFINQILSQFKLTLPLATLEYWDPDFNEWVLLDSLQALPQKVKVRIVGKNVNPVTASNDNNNSSNNSNIQ